MRSRVKIAAFLMALSLLAGCAQQVNPSSQDAEADFDAAYIDTAALDGMETVELEDEAVALAGSPAAVSSQLAPVASGTQVKKCDKAVIDYSNVKDGYVMVCFTGQTSKKLKAQVQGPSSTTYTYNINPGAWTTFPLSDGNGTYKVSVFENVSDKKYANVVSASFSVSLSDEFAPFIRPNQYVDYSNATNTVKKAQELCAGISDELTKVQKVYDFTVQNLTYDKNKAATVQSGYLPVLDTVLATKTGICFDYAALMTGMLRSQGVPCKLVVGYAGTAYHAWISVWSEKDGWIDGAIFFNGTTWQRMDPTFASTGKGNEAILKYIGDGKNYSQKYLY